MPALYLFLFLVWVAASIKSTLFWIYLWQLKEYRLDRFWAEYGDPRKLARFWLFSGGRNFWLPVWTKKAIAIFLLSLVAVGALLLFPVPSSRLPVASPRLLITGYLLLIYLILPILTTLIIFLSKIPTYFIKQATYRRAAQKIRRMKNLLVIGVAGSYGKSSTKEFLAQILSHKFKVIKTPENVNSELGIANFILQNFNNYDVRRRNIKNQSIDVGRQYIEKPEVFVVEMGAYRRGEIKKICEIIKPKIGILTGINEQHLALFGSLENIKKAKFELIEALPKDGLAVFNGENPRVLELAQKYQGKGLIYRHNVVAPKRNMPKHYELNLQGAIDVAKYLGMTEKEIEAAIKEFEPLPKMIRTFTGKNGAFIIGDTYSANPDGVLAALDYLAEQPRKNKILVMPCLIELGSAASEVHQKIGRKIGEICDLAIITTPDCFEDIRSATNNQTTDNLTTNKVILETNPQGVIELLKPKFNPETVILLEGRISNDIVEFAR